MPFDQETRALQQTFSVTLDGLGESTWISVSGLETSLETVERRTVTKTGQTLINRFPGQVTYSDITLTRGFGDLDLYKWFNSVVNDGRASAGDRKGGSIDCYLPDLTPLAKWEFTGAWPLSVSASDVSAQSSEVLIETVVLVVEAVRRTK